MGRIPARHPNISRMMTIENVGRPPPHPPRIIKRGGYRDTGVGVGGACFRPFLLFLIILLIISSIFSFCLPLAYI